LRLALQALEGRARMYCSAILAVVKVKPVGQCVCDVSFIRDLDPVRETWLSRTK
jgi:hypothetical protein